MRRRLGATWRRFGDADQPTALGDVLELEPPVSIGLRLLRAGGRCSRFQPEKDLIWTCDAGRGISQISWSTTGASP
jgi:hypothetical protein